MWVPQMRDMVAYSKWIFQNDPLEQSSVLDLFKITPQYEGWRIKNRLKKQYTKEAAHKRKNLVLLVQSSLVQEILASALESLNK